MEILVQKFDASHGTWILFVGAASPSGTFGNREHRLHRAIASAIGVIYQQPPSCARLKGIAVFGGPTPEHSAFVAASLGTRRVRIHEKKIASKEAGPMGEVRDPCSRCSQPEAHAGLHCQQSDPSISLGHCGVSRMATSAAGPSVGPYLHSRRRRHDT
jgi:hypothetical protein